MQVADKNEQKLEFSDSQTQGFSLPQISDLRPWGTYPDTLQKITLSVSTDIPSICRFEQGEMSFDSMRRKLDHDHSKIKHSLVIDIEPQNKYRFYVKCKSELSDESSKSKLIAFDTYLKGDAQAPIIIGMQPAGRLPSTTRDVNLIVTTNEASLCRYDSEDKSYDQMSRLMGNLIYKQQHIQNINVLNGLSYKYYVSCIDEAGNSSTSTSVINFAVDDVGAVDTVAPLLSGLQPSGGLDAGTRSVLISLSTNETAFCKYSQDETDNYQTMTAMTTTNSQAHSHLVDSLNDGTSYKYFSQSEYFIFYPRA